MGKGDCSESVVPKSVLGTWMQRPVSRLSMAEESRGPRKMGNCCGKHRDSSFLIAGLIRNFNIPLLGASPSLCTQKRSKGYVGESVGRLGRTLVLGSWIFYRYFLTPLKGLCWYSRVWLQGNWRGWVSHDSYIYWEVQRYPWLKGKAMPMYIRNFFLFLPYLVEMEHLCIREFLGGWIAI